MYIIYYTICPFFTQYGKYDVHYAQGQAKVFSSLLKSTYVFFLKVLFHKAADPWHETDPPPFFQTDPSESYRRNQEDVWEITKENLEQQIENYERNGSGWVLSQLLSIDVIFCEMDAKI